MIRVIQGTMRRKIMIAAGVIYLVLIVEFIFYLTSDSDSQEPSGIQKADITQQNQSTTSPAAKSKIDSVTFSTSQFRGNPELPDMHTQTKQEDAGFRQVQATSGRAVGSAQLPDRQETEYASIEEIKKKIYDMNIEYIDDLEALEQIVQTGDADQADFWEGDWYSADDWKRRHDAFYLKIKENGSFSFTTEDRIHQPSQAFTFDGELREFYWEEDYYGKTITHRAKFITPSTLLIIKTSGIKVNLDIYKKGEE
jgi:hypothetical protein